MRHVMLPGMNQVYKNLTLWMVIGLIVILLFTVFQGTQQNGQEQPNFSDFLKAVEQGRVDSVVIRGNLVTYALKDGGSTQKTYVVDDPDLVKTLRDHGVKIAVRPHDSNPWYPMFLQWVPMLLFIGVWIFFMRQMQGVGAKALSFGKARARRISEKQNKVTFQDVAGIDEAKEELREIIEFLRDAQKFQKLGGKIPKGGLLVGPPRTGQTLPAKAIAGEANAPFFSISGSDFVEMFVGVGASRVRDLFAQGKKHAPCIIFMDEIDAVGRRRGAGLGGGHDEREQTLNQLLVEMDGFETNDGVILIAATNRPDVLDPALLRRGRFDRQIVVDMPDVKGREQILRVHTRKIPLGPGVDLERIARGTAGLAGAELANIVNGAALLAAPPNKAVVDVRGLEDAKEQGGVGLERRSRVLSDEERRLIAYHEAGHALVSLSVPGSDPLHKVTIIPRGRALGITAYLPEEELHKYTKQSILSRLAMAYGGRVAEELVFGPEKVTTGAAQDIQHATDIARRMVTQYGMSDTIGPIAVGDREAEIFLGREVVQRREISERTAELVDTEVKRILGDAYERAKTVLLERRDALDRLAAALLERETLDREEVELVVAGKPLPPVPPPPAAPAAPPAGGTTRAKTPARGPVLGSPPPEPAGACRFG